MCIRAKRYHLSNGVSLRDWQGEPQVHPMRSARRVPIERLLKKLGLLDYDHKAPLTTTNARFEQVRVPLQMHIGAPSIPVVKPGDRVKRGKQIAVVPENALGAVIHAPLSGTVTQVTSDDITIARE